MPAKNKTVRPPALRKLATEEELDQLRSTLSSALSPTLALEGFGDLEARCAAVAAAASGAHARSGDAQESFSLEGVDGAAELKDALVAAARDAVALLAPGFDADAAAGVFETISSTRAPVDARLSLRRYPKHDGARQRLGPHVDDTLCTLLWSTGPGLEVLAPADDGDWSGADVAAVGLPTMGGPCRFVEDADWAQVDLSPWGRGALLLTPGHGWPKCAATRKAVPLRSPTLHRVALGGGAERLSLPLLVSLVEAG